MKNLLKIYLQLIIVCSGFSVSAQKANILLRSANMVITASANIIVPGELRLFNSTDSITNNGVIYISGSFTNDGNSFSTLGNGTIIFNGTTTLSGNKNSSFNNFKILPGASVTLVKNIDIKNDWTNNGSFFHGNKTVSFSGSTPVQYVNGSGTFYDIKLQNAVNFSSSKDTIENSFSNSVGGMVDGTSKISFKNTSSLIGSASKYFYDIEVLPGAIVTHTSGSGNIHVANSFTNAGLFTEDPGYTFYFDSSGAAETILGNGLTFFGNITIGGPALSFATSLNTGNSPMLITGDALKFNSKGSSFTSAGAVTFARAVSGTVAIQKASGASAVTASFQNVSVSKPPTIVATAFDPGNGIAVFNNNFTLNDNGSVAENAPVYGPASTLIYNYIDSNMQGTGLEWSSNNVTPAAGAPKNVTLKGKSNIILAGNRSISGNLDIGATDTLKLNDYLLTVNGSFTNTGRLAGSALSGLTINGSAGTAYFVKGLPYNQLKTLTINTGGSLTLGGSAATGDTLNIIGGDATSGYGTVTANGTLNTNGILTLRSNQNGTAAIAASSGNITGAATIERFIPARRAWRYLTAPVGGSQLIRDAWQEGVNNTDIVYANNKNPRPGYGMHISGDNDASKGFDINTTGNPSLLTWNLPTQDWTYIAPPTISTSLSSNRGYFVFVRGSRAVNLSQGQYAVTDSTKLRANGTLSVGEVVTTFTGTAGQRVIAGNPYASSFNILKALANAGTTGLNDSLFYVWDPKLTGNYGVGASVTYSKGIMVPGPSTPSFPNAAAATIIQSGQAFLVQLKQTGNTKLYFEEVNKSAVQNNVFGFASAQIQRSPRKPDPKVYINLNLPQADNSLLLLDGVAAVFDNKYADSVDYNDAIKNTNVYEDMALMRYGKALAIETRPIPNKADTLYLTIGNVLSQPYVLQVLPESVPPAVKQAWLIDKYLNTQTALNTTKETRYTFNTTGDAASYTNRFMIVFTVEPKKKADSTVTPVAKSVNMQKLEGTVSISPNPVTGRQNAQLKFSSMPKGDYEVEMYNSAGRKMMTRTLSHPGGSGTYPLIINTAWAADKYNIAVVNKQTKLTLSLTLVVSK